MGEKKDRRSESRTGNSFRTGAVALAFIIIGYQTALFVREASVSKIVADRDRPDTVFVYLDSAAGLLPDCAASSSGRVSVIGQEKVASSHSEKSDVIYKASSSRTGRLASSRTVESFPFDPNTVSVEDLRRLGFSEKQAASIDNYRSRGGHFSRKSDFAKSFVVSDSVFRRLEPFIEIPLVDINRADSAAFDALPGIGPYYAAKMVELREQLGGYTSAEQLLEIWNFGQERLDGLRDLISVGGAPE